MVSIQISNFIYYLPTCNVSIVKREVFFKSFLVIKWGAIITQSLSIKKSLIMHPIAHLARQNMGCNLQSLFYIMLQSTQGCMKYLVILDGVIMALNCTMSSCINIPKIFIVQGRKKLHKYNCPLLTLYETISQKYKQQTLTIHLPLATYSFCISFNAANSNIPQSNLFPIRL